MKTTLICAFTLTVLSCHVAITSTYPQTYTDRIAGDVSDFRGARDFRDYRDFDDFYNYRNNRPRRVYYYDDDGYGYYSYPTRTPYTNVPVRTPIRREDTTDTTKKYKYTPLVRYKSTRTKRKKLFVPNLWG